MKTRQLTFVAFLFLLSISLQAQLPFGSIGEDFTVTDINDNTHNLYDILDQGKSVVLDLSATWCAPCWNYHQTHILQDLYEDFGPAGTNEIEIFMLEADFNTNTNCLYGPSGCNSSTQGNWVAGITYPIVNLGPNNGPNVKYDYALNYYPTLYKICPNRQVYEVGQASLQTWTNWVSSCNLESSGQTTDAICFEDPNAGVDLTTAGGYGNISYLWSNGATTEDISGDGPGDFSCTITEGNGHYIEVGPYTVDGPESALIATVADQGDVNCNGNNSGFITTDISGGEPGYQYLWSNNATTQNLNNVSGGTYSLTVTDDLGCTESVSATISEPPALTLSTIAWDENCDQQDGSILMSAGGGTGDYTYDIGYGPSSNNYFPNLSAGTYSATVQDENFCLEILITLVDAVLAPDADAGSDEEISCDVNTLELDGTGSSTGNEIIYSWTTDDGNIVSGGDTQTPTVDQPGSYTISVLNFVTGCESIDDVLVEGDINAPDSDAGDDDELNCDVTIVTLDGSNSSSGNNITYEWLNENDDVVSNDSMVDVDTSGIYRLVVLNTENNCSEVDTVVVTENLDTPTADAGDDDELNCTISTITLDGSNSSSGNNITYEWLNENDDVIGNDSIIDVDIPGTFRLVVLNTESGCSKEDSVIVSENLDTPLADAGQDDEINCNNPTTTLDGSNSTTGNDITYEWLNENDEVISTDISVDIDTSGTYRLIVLNTENGCSEQDTVLITENLDTPLADAGQDDEINCNNPTITIDGSNSSSGDNITYEWLNENDDVIGNDSIIELDIPGIFRLVVLNTESGCSEQDTVVISENIETPNADAGQGGELTCDEPSITLDGSGSSSGDNIVFEWIDSNGNTIGTTDTIDVSTEDDYTLIVTDSENGCTSSDDVTVTASTEFPDAAVTGDTDLTCVTNSITLDGSGSSNGSNFSYEWLNSNNDVIGTDMTIDIDEADTYTFVVSDNDNGCTASTDVIIDENTASPDVIIEDPEQLNCINNDVDLDGSNSNGGSLEFEWTDNDGNIIGNTAIVEVSNSGNYTLYLTDTENGCTSSSQVVVVENTESPIAEAQPEGVIDCENTSISIDGSGSSSGNNINYDWTTLDGNIVEGENTINPTVDQAGTYTLVVANTENGCTASIETIVESNAELPTADAGNNAALHCNINSLDLDGSNSSSGQQFSYTWNTDDGNIVEGETTLSPTINAAGTYTLIVFDNETGCSQSSSVEVLNIPEVEIDFESVQNVNCFGESNGSASLNISGGLEPFTYEWSNNETSSSVENLQAGTYIVTVSDVNGCSSNAEITITEPEELIAQITGLSTVECSTSNNGSATLDVNGGIGDYEYEWSNGETTQSVANLNAGEFSVSVTDENECSVVLTGEIFATDDIPPTVVTQNITIALDENGFAVINVSMLNNGSFDNCALASLDIDQNLFDCTALGEQTILLSASDGSGNSASATAIVTIVDDIAPTLNCSDFVSNSCSEVNYPLPEVLDNCSADLILIDGLPSGAEFPEGESLVTYEATDISGNIASCSFKIIVEYDLTSTIEGNDVTCADAADGFAIVIPDGGTPGYNYEWSNGQMTQTANNLPPGEYFVTITDATGCVTEHDVIILEPDPIELEVGEIINATEGNNNGSVEISVNGGVQPYTYEWYLNGQVVSTDEDMTNAIAGEYEVIISDANGCIINSETIVIDNITATIYLNLANHINVLPNPTSGNLFVQIELPESRMIRLSLMDITGKEVLKTEDENITSKQYKLDLTSFTDGIYILKISTDQGIYAQKIVLEKL